MTTAWMFLVSVRVMLPFILAVILEDLALLVDDCRSPNH